MQHCRGTREERGTCTIDFYYAFPDYYSSSDTRIAHTYEGIFFSLEGVSKSLTLVFTICREGGIIMVMVGRFVCVTCCTSSVRHRLRNRGNCLLNNLRRSCNKLPVAVRRVNLSVTFLYAESLRRPPAHRVSITYQVDWKFHTWLFSSMEICRRKSSRNYVRGRGERRKFHTRGLLARVVREIVESMGPGRKWWGRVFDDGGAIWTRWRG